MEGIGIGSDPHEYDVPEPRPWGEQRSVPEGYEVREVRMSSTLNFLWCAVCLSERRPRLGEAPSTSGREAAVTVLDGRALCAEHVAEVLDAVQGVTDH